MEAQLGNLLKLFTIPKAEQDALIEQWAARQQVSSRRIAERTRLNQRLDRLKVLYLEGHLTDADYRWQYVETQAALAEIPPPDDTVTPKLIAKRMSGLLDNMTETWQLDTP